MIARHRALVLVATALATLLVAAACTASRGAPPGSTESAATAAASMTPDPGSAAPSPDASTALASEAPSPPPPVTLAQAWATAPLTDVSTGETFRIADLAGKVIIVETMAIWCSNCRAQQGDVQTALESLPPDDVVFVVLDVDPNEQAASLAAYQVENDFAGRYAIAGSEVARALAAEFGDQMLNPPSTPMLIVGADGTVTRTDFGHKSVEQLVSLVEAHGA